MKFHYSYKNFIFIFIFILDILNLKMVVIKFLNIINKFPF
jgi:hypothetical protein